MEAQPHQSLYVEVKPLENFEYRAGEVFVDSGGSLIRGEEGSVAVLPGRHELLAKFYGYVEKPGPVRALIKVDGVEKEVEIPAEQIEKMCKTYGCPKASASRQARSPVAASAEHIPAFPRITGSDFEKYWRKIESEAVRDMESAPREKLPELYKEWAETLDKLAEEVSAAEEAYQLLSKIYDAAKKLYEWIEHVPSTIKEQLGNYPAITASLARRAATLANEIRQALTGPVQEIAGGFYREQARRFERELLEVYDALRTVAKNKKIEQPPLPALGLVERKSYSAQAEKIKQELLRICSKRGGRCTG